MNWQFVTTGIPALTGVWAAIYGALASDPQALVVGYGLVAIATFVDFGYWHGGAVA